MESSARVRLPAMAPAARKFFEVGKHFEQQHEEGGRSGKATAEMAVLDADCVRDLGGWDF
jgi:hypothetical protein